MAFGSIMPLVRSMGFWKELRRTIKRKFPEAVAIGEVWAAGIPNSDFKTLGIKDKTRRPQMGNKPAGGCSWTIARCSMACSISTSRIPCGAFPTKRTTNRPGRIDCANHFEMGYSPAFSPVLFLDNHDLDRFLFVCHDKTARLIRCH